MTILTFKELQINHQSISVTEVSKMALALLLLHVLYNPSRWKLMQTAYVASGATSSHQVSLPTEFETCLELLLKRNFPWFPLSTFAWEGLWKWQQLRKKKKGTFFDSHNIFIHLPEAVYAQSAKNAQRLQKRITDMIAANVRAPLRSVCGRL